MSSTPLDLNQCSFTLSKKRDYDYPKALTHVNLKAVHPTRGTIGRLSAVRIIRENCRGDFLQVMDAHTQELHDFSLALFDKFGFVRPWLIEPGRRQGTGVWGREFNRGTLVYIADVSVDEKYRSQGLGSRMLDKLKEPGVGEDNDIFVCWPSPVGVRDRAQWVAARNKQVAFFHKNGFRRIGRTSFFGFHRDASHPSRVLPIDGDVEDMADQFDDASNDPTTESEVMKMYPLHYAICHDQGQRVSLTIRSQYVTDPASIHKRDACGFTPLYIATEKGNLHALRTLLELGAARDIPDDNNREGMTTFEKLDSTMRTAREFSEAMLGKWDGYPEDMLKCEFLLKAAVGQPTLPDDEGGHVKKRKWGCTCGSCAGGWFSSRMRFRLKKEALEIGQRMKLENFPDAGPIRDVALLLPDLASLYLPPQVHKSVTKTFYRGYQKLFTAIHNKLHTSPEPLSKNTLLAISIGDNDVKTYLIAGGRVEYALDAVTGIALQDSMYGNESWDERWVDKGQETEYTQLPVCANDLEFPMVRERLGLNQESQWGPYSGAGGGDTEGRGFSDEESEEEYADEEEDEDDEF